MTICSPQGLDCNVQCFSSWPLIWPRIQRPGAHKVPSLSTSSFQIGKYTMTSNCERIFDCKSVDGSVGWMACMGQPLLAALYLSYTPQTYSSSGQILERSCNSIFRQLSHRLRLNCQGVANIRRFSRASTCQVVPSLLLSMLPFPLFDLKTSTFPVNQDYGKSAQLSCRGLSKPSFRASQLAQHFTGFRYPSAVAKTLWLTREYHSGFKHRFGNHQRSFECLSRWSTLASHLVFLQILLRSLLFRRFTRGYISQSPMGTAHIFVLSRLPA